MSLLANARPKPPPRWMVVTSDGRPLANSKEYFSCPIKTTAVAEIGQLVLVEDKYPIGLVCGGSNQDQEIAAVTALLQQKNFPRVMSPLMSGQDMLIYFPVKSQTVRLVLVSPDRISKFYQCMSAAGWKRIDAPKEVTRLLIGPPVAARGL
jgi:hypothetical protein